MTGSGRSVVTDQELKLVEDALEQAVASGVSLLTEASGHIIGSGGKRLRPRVVLLSYKATGGNDIRAAVPVAATVELLHTASLVHDDIIDYSDLRRGEATINARWGDHVALLAGDFLFFKLLSLVAPFDSRAIEVLAGCCTEIVEGETLEMLWLGNTSMTEETYLAVISKKTASLFSACAELGAIQAGATPEQVAALREYGLDLGIAFQIRDDALDLVGKTDELGKPVGSDLKQGNMSLATLFAMRMSGEAEEIFRSRHVERGIQLLRETGALDYATQEARRYSERAKNALSNLPASEAKVALCELADFVVARDQ